MHASNVKQRGASGKLNGGKMFLAGLSDPRSFLGPDAVSFSELQTMSGCEQKWFLQYNEEHEKSDPTAPMQLGTEMHRLLDNWWMNGADDSWSHTDDETALYLIGRYHEHYMNGDPLIMEQVNVPFAVKWGDTWLFGWFDGIVRNHETGERWIVEFKTMGNWSRMNQIPVDKQISLYLLAAGIMGLDVAGVMFDAILTTYWKTEDGEVYKSGPRKGEPKDFHASADSFRREWVQRTGTQIVEFTDELNSALRRRNQLRQGYEAPIRNVGQSCDYCPLMPACYGISLELLDE